MFIGFAQAFEWLTGPSHLILAVGLVGLALMCTRFKTLGKRLMIAGYLSFGIIGISPLAFALMLPLEQRFPRWDASQGAPDGIIILGGVIDTRLSAARGEISLSGAAERVMAIAELARRYPAAKIVFAGGSANAHPAEADLAARLFQDFGISHNRIVTERDSLSTLENATFTKRIVDAESDLRWLLVTSAVHMPRAIGTFR